MKTANVSFGKVLAVYAKRSKIKKVNNALQDRANQGQLVMRDVTSNYYNAPTYGLLASAAQNGDTIEIYITGDDVKKVGKEQGWTTIEGILSHMNACISGSKLRVEEIVDRVVKG